LLLTIGRIRVFPLNPQHGLAKYFEESEREGKGDSSSYAVSPNTNHQKHISAVPLESLGA
jgi:hypothetical protein